MEENPDLTEYNGVVIKGVDINGDVVDATKVENRDSIINRVNPTISSILNGVGDSVTYEALGIVGDNIQVVRDSASKFQWAVVTKTGIKYVRKIPLVSGATLVVTLNEASKNMSDEEFMSFATKEISKATISYGGSMAVGTLVGGPLGTVAGVLAGPAFEKGTDMTLEQLSAYLSKN